MKLDEHERLICTYRGAVVMVSRIPYPAILTGIKWKTSNMNTSDGEENKRSTPERAKDFPLDGVHQMLLAIAFRFHNLDLSI